MDRGAPWDTAHGVTESQTRLRLKLNTHFSPHLPMSIKEIAGKEEQVKLHQKETIGQIQNMQHSTVKIYVFLKLINDRGRGR